MSETAILWTGFSLFVLGMLALDLGVFHRKSHSVGVREALTWTAVWIALAMIFNLFIYHYFDKEKALEFFTAYLIEKSLSIDNIFVFILIFTFFRIHSDHIARALLIGILMAIVFRVIFITVGVVLVERFNWLLYIFGAFLVYTGIKIFTVKHEEEYDPSANPVYKFLNRFLPIIHEDVSGKMWITQNGKRLYTNMFLVVVMLATTDIVFALDSIPAVFAIVTESPNKELIIYTSNIFAVLGLRSLYFLLRGAVDRFQYLQQGIAIVLIFIGLKMLVPLVIKGFHVPVTISLVVIVVCLGGSILYSIQASKQEEDRI